MGTTGVSVGGIGVSVGGMGVSVGGDTVSVGGTGVFVLVGGIGVNVLVGGGGGLVCVGAGSGVFEGVAEGALVAVGFSRSCDLVGRGVQVIKVLAVLVLEGTADAVPVAVREGVTVGIYSEISTAVIATAVLMGLENAESTIS